MNKPIESIGLRQPLEPYPGLRPFLDHEASLLLGRNDQISQIVDRLKDTRFVAVIGGSGSGKSSLIRAGVVPRLRAFGISDAGDYWIPVIYTPGTSNPEDTQGPHQHPQTPVTRLAWKFARTLAPQNSDSDTQALCDEIATVFRQGSGFTRLVRSYHELLPVHGPQSDKARFLFVLDQFEELFHPNNRHSEDARLVIEAVIDHFADPDPRCFVVMTMRSEHLADCAAYLQLPDAINRSFYLIRRLKRPELRDVIMGPAHVFLRMQQRAGTTLQHEVSFAPEVVQRLVADVERMEDDPDHLPLLQHLLARLWQTAKEREGLQTPQDSPTSITWDDLALAADPGRKADPQWWQEHAQASTLRLCLENWAQHVYNQRSALDRQQLDEVLRHLAFKDPNNGQYFQERVNVDDPQLLPGFPSPRNELRRLLDHGFIDSVNYLFWDKENPALVTLKVSHESFIRGWPHFRQLIDVEAERFDEFVTVLRRCLDWMSGEQRPNLLLEAADLERLAARRLAGVFQSEAELSDWFHVLRQARDGERLSSTRTIVPSFFRTSLERQQQIREAEEYQRKEAEAQKERARLAKIASLESDARARQAEAESARKDADLARAREATSTARNEVIRARLIRWIQLLVIGVASLYIAFTRMVKDPAFESIKLFSQAQTLTKYRPESNGNPQTTASMEELQYLLIAAQDTQRARRAFPILFESPTDSDKSPGTARLGQWTKPLLPTREYEELVRVASTEGGVNAALRGLLTNAIWSSQSVPATTQSPANVSQKNCEVIPEALPDQKSLVQASDPSSTHPLPGSPRPSAPVSEFGLWIRSTDQDRAVFIPNKKNEGDPIRVLQASVHGSDCRAARKVAEFSSSPWPMALLMDDRLSRLALAQFGTDGNPLTTIFSIEWQWNPQTSTSMLQIAPIRQLTEINAAVMPFRELASGDRPNDPRIPSVKVVKTLATGGGHEIAVDKKGWRLLSRRALPVEDPAWGEHWLALERPKAKTICERIGAQAMTPDGSQSSFRSESWALPALGTCLTIARPELPGLESKQVHPQVPVNVSVYDIPLSGQPVAATASSGTEQPNQQTASGSGGITPSADWTFDTQTMGQTNQWWIGKPGTKYEGWLAASPENEGNSPKTAKAAPYSTGALIKLGCDIWWRADPAFKPKDGDLALKDICPPDATAQKY